MREWRLPAVVRGNCLEERTILAHALVKIVCRSRKRGLEVCKVLLMSSSLALSKKTLAHHHCSTAFTNISTGSDLCLPVSVDMWYIDSRLSYRPMFGGMQWFLCA